jgi:alpha-tubulin suppressor-like RCC1 family protein
MRLGENNFPSLSALSFLICRQFAVFAGLVLASFTPLAMAATTSIFGWGNNYYGQLNIPQALTDVVQIAVGDSHNLVLRKDGSATGWGYNTYGQATPPVTAQAWAGVAAGNYFSLGVLADGTVRAWGLNDYSQTSVPSGLTGVSGLCG